MNAMIYLLRCNITNWFKSLLKRPLILLIYVAFIAMMIYSFASSYKNIGESDAKMAAYYPAITAGFGVYLLFGAIKRGEKKGSGFFSMADVHLLFPSPIHPSTVLAYGTLGQMISLLLICVIMLFQITTLRLFFGLSIGGILGMIGSLVLTLFSTQCLSMFYYAFLSKDERRRAWGKRISVGVLLALAALLAFFYLQTKKPVQAFTSLAGVAKWFPLGGWFALASLAAQQGTWWVFGLISLLQVVLGGVLLVSLIRIQPHYYEDVLDTAQRMQSMVEQKKSGAVQQTARVKNLKNFPFIGKGAFAIFGRHLISHVRQGFFDGVTLALVVVSALWPLMMGGLLDDSPIFTGDTRTTVAFIAYMMMLLSMQSFWTQELKKPFIFLIPDSSGKKIMAATMMGFVKSLADGLLAAIPAVLISRSPLYHIPLFALATASFSAVYTMGDVLARRLLGETHAKGLGMAITFICMIVCIIPSLILLFVFPPWIGYLACTGINLLIATVVLLLCDGLFSRIGFEANK